MEVKDTVIYLEDKEPILYCIKDINNEFAWIVGKYYRIMRKVSLDKVRLATNTEIEAEERLADVYYINLSKGNKREKKRYILGRVLHIDGDKSYLDRCLDLYKKMGIKAEGVCIDEKEMPLKIDKYLDIINPDIVVITGHDVYNEKGLKDLNNYANTLNFVETVKKIRKRRSSYDCCVIAGACQSNFEALIASGADFASSPKRINVHTFDPAVIAIKVATTSFLRIVNLDEALKYIENGRNAFGGVESFGKMKLMM